MTETMPMTKGPIVTEPGRKEKVRKWIEVYGDI